MRKSLYPKLPRAPLEARSRSSGAPSGLPLTHSRTPVHSSCPPAKELRSTEASSCDTRAVQCCILDREGFSLYRPAIAAISRSLRAPRPKDERQENDECASEAMQEMPGYHHCHLMHRKAVVSYGTTTSMNRKGEIGGA